MLVKIEKKIMITFFLTIIFPKLTIMHVSDVIHLSNDINIDFGVSANNKEVIDDQYVAISVKNCYFSHADPWV